MNPQLASALAIAASENELDALRNYLSKNPEILRAFLVGVGQAIHGFPTAKAEIRAILGKVQHNSDPELELLGLETAPFCQLFLSWLDAMEVTL